MKGLTPKQREILNYLTTYIEDHHYAPSYREIKEHFSFSSLGTVYKYVHTLKKKGMITLDKQAHRSIQFSKPEQTAQKSTDLSIPLIANLTPGYPLELFAKPQQIQVPPSLVHSPENTYLLQIQGDSLLEDGIHNGDLILIEARTDIHPGEYVLGLINQHDSVLRRYYPEGQYIRLESQNKNHPSFTIKLEHITIQGALVGLIRVY